MFFTMFSTRPFNLWLSHNTRWCYCIFLLCCYAEASLQISPQKTGKQSKGQSLRSGMFYDLSNRADFLLDGND